MTALSDFVAAENAALTSIVPAPVAPLGYGVDLACVADISQSLAETAQSSTDGVRESLLRRLQTPRGFLGGIGDDENYGWDVVGLLNAGTTEIALRNAEAGIRSEILADDRVETAVVAVSFEQSTNTLSVSAKCTARSADVGQFSLVFSVNTAGLLVQEVG
jgi:hypothetical protein